VAFGNRTDGRDQLVGGGLFGYITGGPGFQHLKEILLILVDGESQNFPLRVDLLDPPGRFQTVHFGHRYVHNNYIRPGFFDQV
jgi:hypothetical protein